MRMRKKRRGNERLCALSALFVSGNDYNDEKKNLFAEEKPLRLEIGCGKGDFIIGTSEKEPDYNYIAMERVLDVAVIAAEKYAGVRGLGKLDPHGGWAASDGNVYNNVRWEIPLTERGNVRFMVGDAADIVDYFGEGVFDTVYANFSDPWPKERYADRRLTAPGFLKKYLKVLRDGGIFRFKTDNADLFEFSLETLKAEEGFEITYFTRDLHNSEKMATNVMTEYERNFSEKGVNINYVEAYKK